MLSDDQLSFEIVQAAHVVHEALGPGFVEAVYHRAFGLELRNRGMTVEREKLIRIVYGAIVVGRHYLDLVVNNRAVVELKASRAIIPVFEAQVRSYLAATDHSFGLIINFGGTVLEWKAVNRDISKP